MCRHIGDIGYPECVSVFCQDLPLYLELFVLTAQTTQFGPFFGGQAVFTPALVQVILFDPVADGVLR